MRHRAKIGFLLTTGVLFLAGCEQTTRQVQIRPPAATPAPVSASVHEALPFPSRPPNQVFPRDTRPAIDILVESVEGKLKVGQQEYQEGNASKARVDFNAALDQILASGFSADFDPRLSKLFDETGEAINSYEATATEGTDEGQIVQAPGQPAPIDEIADLTLPAADPRLALKAEKELISVPHDLPLTVNESVLQYLSFFTTTHGRAIVEHGLQRAGRYNDMIRRVLSEEGVPQDLIYLAQAESAFQPQAVSRSGARGIWQFMPFRGEEYDLERSYWVDERSDPEKATHAAARHLRDLYQMFGDWYLVMAAYNSGPLNVSRAVERTGYADFWQLQKNNALSERNPKLRAHHYCSGARRQVAGRSYGVAGRAEKPAQVEVVKLEHPIDLHLVSDATGADHRL